MYKKNLKKTFLFTLILILSVTVKPQCPTIIPIAKDSCKIGPGSVQVGASGSTGYYSWYDSNVGGTFLSSGTPFNTPSINTTTTFYVAASDTNYTLDFDGSNDYVSLGNPTQLQITGDMTIEMWLKPDNFSARRNPYAKAYGGEGTITQELSGTLNFYYGTNGGNGSPYQGFNSGASLTLNEWNHIAIVRDLTNMQMYWYINGILTNQTNATYAVAIAGVNPATIGAGYTSNYDGEIDEVRIWNTARTQPQIQTNKELCLSGGETGLVAYYQFNDKTGNSLTDLATSSNNGVLTNMDSSLDWVVANFNYHCISCESSRTAVLASINPGTPVELGNDKLLSCGETSVVLDAGLGYFNYLWSTGESTSEINVSTSGNYWVQVDDAGGCSDSDTITVVNSSGSLNALSFNGTNNYVSLGNPTQLQITGDMTIEMWLKPDNFSARRNPYAKAYGGEGTITQELNGTLNFYYGTNGGNGNPYQGFNSGASLTLNEWNHIAIVRDLTNMQLYWYINGVLTNQTVAVYASAATGINVATIGTGYTSNYDGEIDEVRIWNESRSQIEIRNKMCSKLSGSESNLTTYYRFDEGSANVLVDATANGLDGVINNGSNWVVSGAAIGNNSSYVYPNSWVGQSLTLQLCTGENLTVDNMTGSPEGLHIYSVGDLPNSTTGIAGLGGNDRYFGVFKVNDATATYRATYNYTSNPHVGVLSEPTLELFKRNDNAAASWVSAGATLNTGANTLIATAQGTEFILGSSGVPLPISLVSFTAILNDDKVDLKWITSTEINNDYFTIERSSNAEVWEEFLTIGGAGNSNQIQEYFDVDYEPLKGISYYRLKQTDYNGKFEYFNVVPVKYDETNSGNGTINLFPNPVSVGENLNIKFQNIFEKEMLVVLRDVKGREFYSKVVVNIANGKLVGIPINHAVPKGVYLVTATSENVVYSQKIIVR